MVSSRSEQRQTFGKETFIEFDIALTFIYHQFPDITSRVNPIKEI